MPYETTAREASNFDFPVNPPLRRPASLRRKSSREYRRDQVIHQLRKVLMRNDVKYFLGQMRNIKAPGLGTKQIDRSLTIEDFDNICVRYSTVGRLVSRQIDLTVDAKDLIEYLANRIETRGAKTKYELYKVERWCRAQLESNTPILQDTTKVQAALINAACDWQGKVDAQPAGPDQVRPIVIELMREYKIEK